MPKRHGPFARLLAESTKEIVRVLMPVPLIPWAWLTIDRALGAPRWSGLSHDVGLLSHTLTRGATRRRVRGMARRARRRPADGRTTRGRPVGVNFVWSREKKRPRIGGRPGVTERCRRCDAGASAASGAVSGRVGRGWSGERDSHQSDLNHRAPPFHAHALRTISVILCDIASHSSRLGPLRAPCLTLYQYHAIARLSRGFRQLFAGPGADPP
jgi:hypothetical protein